MRPKKFRVISVQGHWQVSYGSAVITMSATHEGALLAVDDLIRGCQLIGLSE